MHNYMHILIFDMPEVCNMCVFSKMWLSRGAMFQRIDGWAGVFPKYCPTTYVIIVGTCWLIDQKAYTYRFIIYI